MDLMKLAKSVVGVSVCTRGSLGDVPVPRPVDRVKPVGARETGPDNLFSAALGLPYPEGESGDGTLPEPGPGLDWGESRPGLFSVRGSSVFRFVNLVTTGLLDYWDKG